MNDFDKMFGDDNKVAINNNGEIFKFNNFTEGCKFMGTYLGYHTWDADGDVVVAHDFANVTIDGKQQEENQVYAINEFAALGKFAKGITPGAIVGIQYNGKNTAIKGNPHDITAFIDPNNRDENWQRFQGRSLESLGGTAEVSPNVGAEGSNDTVDASEAFGATPESVPFKSPEELQTEIKMLVAEKYNLKDENEVKTKILEDAELPFNSDFTNLTKVLTVLQAKYAV